MLVPTGLCGKKIEIMRVVPFKFCVKIIELCDKLHAISNKKLLFFLQVTFISSTFIIKVQD